ncbi:hypothetical protein lerEdw1_005072 [Lerista edwardsae]|nr:hypothetical protein lerEdw1_005072 [Lerista edwardsae]
MSASSVGSYPGPRGQRGRGPRKVAWASKRWSSSVGSASSYGHLLSITPSNSGYAPSVPEREPCQPHLPPFCILGCSNLAQFILHAHDHTSQDEFQRYFKKKVTWIDLLTVLGINKLDVPVADKDSVISKAIMKPDFKVRYIQVQKIRYVWDFSSKQFHRVGSLEDSNTCYEIHQKFGAGLTRREQELRRLVCGPNSISVEIRPVWKLLFKEILNPFYVFQAFTLTLWLTQGYIEYSVAIIILSIISVGLTVYDLRQQSVKLHHLVEKHNRIIVTVLRKHEGSCKMESRYLVPGDVLVLEGQKLSLPCDAVLLDGSCVVNEGMLTGESVPVTKTPLPSMDNSMPWKTHSVEDYRRHVLFCGTEVVQTKRANQGPARAVVLQTGFDTAKGDLVRSILYPKPLNFKLYRDVFKFIVCLALIGVLGLIYATCVYVIREQPVADTVAMALLLLTVAVPPAIPAALTTCIVYAQKRLKKKKIFCISPQRINICGQINLVCFDKTGTLTEDGLDLWGVTPCQSSRSPNFHSFSSGRPVPFGPICKAMATCHSLMVLDGKIQGDPLDVKMFEGTKWEIVEKEETPSEQSKSTTSDPCMEGYEPAEATVEGIKILHQFPFSSSIQRMSVITQELGKTSYDLYTKGAPEVVAGFCKANTIPPNFQKGLKFYTSQGFRVIALAQKALSEDTDLQSLEREDLECNLTFLGLLVMENRLKTETRVVLEELIAARIRIVMVTGDNLLTAVTVAKNSGMISSSSKVILVEASAPKGPSSATVTWRLMEKTHLDSPEVRILLNGTVFARMTPGQKSTLVEEFQKLDYYVGMCGDGANDCGALKVAHAGISLSEQEASVASPFTSQIATIQCVPELIREGRASLVASFAVFKYLTLYGMIQFIGTSLLYWQLQFFSNYQYFMQDICITLLVCLTMSLTHAYPRLAPFRPPGKLISPPLLLSVVLQVCLAFLVQTFAFLIVKLQPWYSELRSHSGCPPGDKPLSPGNGTANATVATDRVLSYEGSTLWPLVTVHCIIVAFVFSKGKPFRKPVYTNYIFCCLLCLQLGVSLFLFFADFDVVYKWMGLLCTPMLWRVYVLLMLLLIFVVSFWLEDVFLQNRRVWATIKAWCRYRSSSQYRKWQRRLEREASWPPVNQREFAHGSKGYLNLSYHHGDKEV